MKKFFKKIKETIDKRWENPFFEEPDESIDSIHLKVVSLMIALAIFFFGWDTIIQWDIKVLLAFIIRTVYILGVFFFFGAKMFKKNHGYYPWQKKQ